MHLLGDFSLLSGDASVTTLHVARLQSLLSYLVLHRDAPQARSHLAFLLWPDSDEAQAYSNLRKLLHQLARLSPMLTTSSTRTGTPCSGHHLPLRQTPLVPPGP